MSIEITYTVYGIKGNPVLVTKDEKKAKEADKTVTGTIELRDFIISKLPDAHGLDESVITDIVIDMFDNKDAVLSILKKGKTKASPMTETDVEPNSSTDNDTDNNEKNEGNDNKSSNNEDE